VCRKAYVGFRSKFYNILDWLSIKESYNEELVGEYYLHPIQVHRLGSLAPKSGSRITIKIQIHAG
jgi:hypothetical protein